MHSMTDNKHTKAVSIVRTLLCMLLAFCLVDALNRYFFWHTSFSDFNDRPFHSSSILNLFAFAGAFMLFHGSRSVDRRALRFSAVYAVLMAGALVLGRSLYLTDRLSSVFFPRDNFLSSIVIFVGFSALITALCVRLLPLLADEHIPVGPEENRGSLFLFAWILIFMAWFPALLAYYPGIHTYDVYFQTPQALGPLSVYNRIHPPLHTMFWALCIRLAGRVGLNPITFYGLLQMLAVSASFARVLAVMQRMRVNRFVLLGALVFFAFNPVLAIFSMIVTKDVLFGAFLLLLFLECLLLVRDPFAYLHDPRAVLRFVGCCVLTLLLRNNAVFMLLLALPFFLLVLRRHALRVVLLFAMCLIPWRLISGPLYDALGIQPALETEALCVPLSQIANVALNDRDSLSGEDEERIARYIPIDRIEDAYNPRFADYIKFYFNSEEYLRDRGTFFRLWLSLLRQYPDSYVCAFLDLNLPYWYPDAAMNDYWAMREYIEVDNTYSGAFPTERYSKLPWLLARYNRVSSFSAFENRPVLSTLFSISTPIWLLLFCALVIGWKRQWRLLLPLSLPFFLWLTYMAGPVSNFRYMEPLITMYPLWIGMALQPRLWMNSGLPAAE